MKDKNLPIGLVVPHTHWDREWRSPLWKTRSLLVEFMDQLMQVLESDPEYRCFVLDGQCVVLEDYLEVRPEQEARIRGLISTGRIAIGPWYTLPDLYPVDGECLVRNLLRGFRYARAMGKVLPMAYTSFGWGQTAQFPQIFAGFGIDFVITAKRVSTERAPNCEFMWEAPDGTRLLTTRLGGYGRANFFMNAYLQLRFGLDYNTDEFCYDLQQGGQVYHRADVQECYRDHMKIAMQNGYYPEKLLEAIDISWRAMDESLVPDFRILMAGSDFTSPLPILPKIVRDANALLKDKQLRMGTLEEYREVLMQKLNPDDLVTVYGELRDGPSCTCSGNALATRIYLKQQNRKAQNLLLRRTEPLSAALAMLGEAYPTNYLQIAWKHMLLSHAHDSINGVTHDKIADDVMNRLSQVQDIADTVYEESLAHLITRLDLSAYDTKDVLLLAVNPLPYPVREVVKICVDTPQVDNVWEFGLVDAAGQELGVQHVSRQEMTIPVNDLDSRPWPFYVDRHMAYVDTGVIPAGGYAILQVVPKQHFSRKAVFWPDMRTSTGGDISAGANQLENEYLAVEVQANGTINLTDKTTGRCFSDLLAFEDAGDVGDYWVFYPPYNDRIYTSLGCAARIWCEDNGPLAATIGIEIKMPVPAYGERPESAIRGESKRSAEMTELQIITHLTLKRGAKQLEVTTRVVNTARDHRLRLLLPTDIDATHSCAAGHFTVDKRPILQTRETVDEFYPEMQTLPQQTFVDIADEGIGLAVVNDSLTEYEVKGDARHTLALTLFRSVRNILCTEFRSASVFSQQEGGQCLRTLEFHYGLYPHQGDWQQAGVQREAEKLNVPPTMLQLSAHARGEMKPVGSLYEIEPAELVLSTLKKAEDRDSYIMRLYNPTEREVDGKVTFLAEIKSAYLTNLDEVRSEEMEVTDGHAVAVNVAKQQIVTIELVV
jgi:mannosylglycerate hydrolase